jgi:hypothetical protein
MPRGCYVRTKPIWNKGIRWKRVPQYREKVVKDFNYLPYFCECGCWEICGPGNRYIHGHNQRGKPAGYSNHKNSKETKEKRRKTLFERGNNKRMGNRKSSPNFKLNSSAFSKEKWLIPEYAKRLCEAQNRKPNKTEIFTDGLIQKTRPTDFIYSGDGKIFIAGKCPDWFNVNGKKQVIEFLGDYWHGEKRTGRTKEQEEKGLIDHYKRYGYNCLIIWESELKNLDKVVEKIENF